MNGTRSAWLAALMALALVGESRGEVPEASPAAAVRPAGPALREAIAALATDPAAGRTQLAAVARAHPRIADHADHQALLSWQRAGDMAQVAALAQAFARAHPESPLLARVAELEADADAALGDFTRARAGYERAQKGAASREDRGRLALLAARMQLRAAATEDGARALLAVWRDFAPTPAAQQARHELALIPGGVERVTGADHAARCRSLFAAFWNDDALRACDAALASGQLAERERGRLAALRAELLFRDRRYPEAERAFAALPDSRENRFWRARALARSGRLDESKAAFERLGAGTDDWAARALFLAGTLYEDDDVARASERFRESLAKAKRAELRVEARWRLAWRAYLERRWSDAARDLAALASDTADPIEALRARYWQARALARGGDATGAPKLATLARDWSFTYYGQQSAERAQGAPPESSESPERPSDPAGAVALAPDALARPRILLEAGLAADAGAEARELASRRGLPQSDRLALAALLQDAGQYDAAQRVILDAYAVPLAAGPRGGEPDLWWAAYPQAFAPDVARAAAKAGIPPPLLFAVMREESGFRPQVLSAVGARGLVQIMPETGRRLAEGLGATSYTPDELFIPARNLELGAAYLAQLLARFDGRVSAAVASYNAGPEAVERWLAQGAALEDDEWIESIPYDQTRSYAKRVLRSFNAYRTLY
jgi:soluble lytic murein transglycosylase